MPAYVTMPYKNFPNNPIYDPIYNIMFVLQLSFFGVGFLLLIITTATNIPLKEKKSQVSKTKQLECNVFKNC